MRKVTVMFFCTTNNTRSQMAEGLMRYYAGENFDVYSAGLNPQPINSFTQRVMKEVGIDISQSTPRSALDFLGKDVYSYAITLCDYDEPDCPTVFPGVINALYWPVEDPEKFVLDHDQTLAKYREARDLLTAKIKEWLNTPKINGFVSPATAQAAQ